MLIPAVDAPRHIQRVRSSRSEAQGGLFSTSTPIAHSGMSRTLLPHPSILQPSKRAPPVNRRSRLVASSTSPPASPASRIGFWKWPTTLGLRLTSQGPQQTLDARPISDSPCTGAAGSTSLTDIREAARPDERSPSQVDLAAGVQGDDEQRQPVAMDRSERHLTIVSLFEQRKDDSLFRRLRSAEIANSFVHPQLIHRLCD